MSGSGGGSCTAWHGAGLKPLYPEQHDFFNRIGRKGLRKRTRRWQTNTLDGTTSSHRILLQCFALHFAMVSVLRGMLRVFERESWQGRARQARVEMASKLSCVLQAFLRLPCQLQAVFRLLCQCLKCKGMVRLRRDLA